MGHDADYIQIRPLFHQHSGSELLTITANTGKNCTFSILEQDASWLHPIELDIANGLLSFKQNENTEYKYKKIEYKIEKQGNPQAG